MKSPSDLAKRLSRQWQKGDLRESRLLGDEGSWPIVLPITRPSAQAIQNQTQEVKAHLDRWRAVKNGEVKWQEINYRATSHSIEVPTQWMLNSAAEWTAAAADSTILDEYQKLAQLLIETDPLFHPLLIRRRPLWRNLPVSEIVQATQLALALQPACAQGRPLRALSLAGIDTKFFERNERLIVALLDTLHDGEATRLGLEEFLGAYIERDHWLLVLDLDGKLLPFTRQRVSSIELAKDSLPGSHLLIIENETCQHQLPTLPNTIAVLGSGFDLNWTQSAWLFQKKIAYWGDLDTWGLELLARARQNQPQLTALLMDQKTFQTHNKKAVSEPTPAGPIPNSHLMEAERDLYQTLLANEEGRLEQEFIPQQEVHKALQAWRMGSSFPSAQ